MRDAPRNFLTLAPPLPRFDTRAFVTFIVLLWVSSALGGALTLGFLDLWPLDPGAWELLTADGTEIPLAADPPMPGSLAAGQARTITLVAETDVDLESAFIAYVDTEAATFVFVVALD